MTEFKSFADFKRRVTHMTMVKAGWYRDGVFVDTTSGHRLIGVKREVHAVNSVDIMLKTDVAKSGVSHLRIGKASEWTFDGTTVTHDDGHGLLQYAVEARE